MPPKTEAQKQEAQFQHDIKVAFNSTEGRRLLEELEKRYCGRLENANIYLMATAVGRSDLIYMLKELRDE